MTRRERMRRSVAMVFWRLFNPVARSLAGLAPWWVVLETTGRRSGKPRRVPLARGPVDGQTAWLICVHGTHASFAHNIAANPRVRLKLRGRWRDGVATLRPLDPDVLGRFSRYARMGPRTVGIEPKLIRVDLDDVAPLAAANRPSQELRGASRGHKISSLGVSPSRKATSRA